MNVNAVSSLGCSSLFGELIELGPLLYDIENEKLKPNPYAWNKKVNLLFLESPSGVGFTYRPGQTDFSTDDDETAHLNFGALESFFQKFPHLSSNDFYLTGESYAGFYIPTLSMLALDKKFPENFKGIAIGDGLLDWDLSPNRGKSNFLKEILTRIKDDEEDPWMNKPEVKRALHIDADWSGTWTECNMNVLGLYDEGKNHDMKQQIIRIINSGLRTLIYQGEIDPLISWTGNKK